eukprot:3310901-Heterocapsa_arctica.AAC.1
MTALAHSSGSGRQSRSPPITICPSHAGERLNDQPQETRNARRWLALLKDAESSVGDALSIDLPMPHPASSAKITRSSS